MWGRQPAGRRGGGWMGGGRQPAATGPPPTLAPPPLHHIPCTAWAAPLHHAARLPIFSSTYSGGSELNMLSSTAHASRRTCCCACARRSACAGCARRGAVRCCARWGASMGAERAPRCTAAARRAPRWAGWLLPRAGSRPSTRRRAARGCAASAGRPAGSRRRDGEAAARPWAPEVQMRDRNSRTLWLLSASSPGHASTSSAMSSRCSSFPVAASCGERGSKGLESPHARALRSPTPAAQPPPAGSAAEVAAPHARPPHTAQGHGFHALVPGDGWIPLPPRRAPGACRAPRASPSPRPAAGRPVSAPSPPASPQRLQAPAPPLGLPAPASSTSGVGVCGGRL
jgi:hypothetical protein